MAERPSYVVRSRDVPEHEAHYPAPFDTERLTIGRDLGTAAGAVRIGAWLERLPPNRRTSFTHAHAESEEAVFVVEGPVHLRVIEPSSEPKEIPLETGDYVSFPAGTGIAHCLWNRGERDAVLLVVGERRATDRTRYPEDPGWSEHAKAMRPQTYWK